MAAKFVVELPSSPGSSEALEQSHHDIFRIAKLKCKDVNKFMIVSDRLCLALASVFEYDSVKAEIILNSPLDLKWKIRVPVNANSDFKFRPSDSLLCVQPLQHNYLNKWERNIRIFTLKPNVVNDTIKSNLEDHRYFLISVLETAEKVFCTFSSKYYSDSPIHLIVRVSDQTRDPSVKESLRNYPAYLSDDIFAQFFGDSPQECEVDGVAYYISNPISIDRIKEFFNDTCGQVFELTFLVAHDYVKVPAHLTRGLEAEFVGKEMILKPFVEYVEHVIGLPEHEITSRIIHIPQSSGTGKTRLCLELLYQLNSGCYCVYRKEDTAQHAPPTCNWMKIFVLNFQASKSATESLLLCLSFFKALLVCDPFKHYKDLEKVKSIFLSGRYLNNVIEADFTVRFLKIFRPDAKRAKFDASDASKAKQFEIELIESITKNFKSARFVIVFDESQELMIRPDGEPWLMDLYGVIRHALALLEETKICVIFVGVKPSPNEFVRYWKREPSMLKMPREPDALVVPPYMLTDTFDVLLTEPVRICYDDFVRFDFSPLAIDAEVYRSEALEAFAVKAGRPLWNHMQKYYTAFEAAVKRLKTDKKLSGLACFILRTGVSIVPQDPLAFQLVQSGMATLLHINSDGSHCSVYYFPEPLLSNAARIKMTTDSDFLNGLKEFIRRMNLGTFKESESVADLIGRLMLLRAFDRGLLHRMPRESALSQREPSWFQARFEKIENDRFITPKYGIMKTGQFLQSFTGRSAEYLKKSLEVPDELWDGFVSLNQFSKVDSSVVMDQAFLLDAFARSSGFALWHEAPGADAIVPILRTDGLMGCIAIQLENLRSKATFPYNFLDYSEKLRASKMKFLKFGQIGDFKAVPDSQRNIIRIVVQFGPRNSAEVAQFELYSARNNLKVLWMNGLPCFYHLFAPLVAGASHKETSEAIVDCLHQIIANDRDYYDGVQFKELAANPLRRQTSRTGAITLRDAACPLLNNRYSAIYNSQCRTRYGPLRDVVMRDWNSVQITAPQLKFRERFTVTSKKIPTLATATLRAASSGSSGSAPPLQPNKRRRPNQAPIRKAAPSEKDLME